MKSRSSKAALIQSLAESVGLTENFDTKTGQSHYDPDTGTFYCEGMPLPHSSMKEIKDWYRQQMVLYKEKSTESRQKMDYFMRYAVAYNAICMMENQLDEEGNK